MCNVLCGALERYSMPCVVFYVSTRIVREPHFRSFQKCVCCVRVFLCCLNVKNSVDGKYFLLSVQVLEHLHSHLTFAAGR